MLAAIYVYIQRNHTNTSILRCVGMITVGFLMCFKAMHQICLYFSQVKAFDSLRLFCLVYQTYKLIFETARKNAFILNVLRKYVNKKSCKRTLNPTGKGNPGHLLKIVTIYL